MTISKSHPILFCIKRDWDVLSRNPSSGYWFSYCEKKSHSEWAGSWPERDRGWLVAGTNSLLSVESTEIGKWHMCEAVNFVQKGLEAWLWNCCPPMPSWEGKSFGVGSYPAAFDLKSLAMESVNSRPRQADLCPAPTGPSDSAKVPACTGHGGKLSWLLAIEMSNKSCLHKGRHWGDPICRDKINWIIDIHTSPVPGDSRCI